MFACTYRRARTQPFTQAGTQLAGKGATNAVSPEEFTDFYAASFRRLVGQLYAMTGNHAEAQDAVQEAFIRAWAHRRQLERSGAPEAWVRATAWRIAVSRWQRARVGRTLMRSYRPVTVTDDQGLAHPRTDARTVADAGSNTNAGGLAHPGTNTGINTDAQALALRTTVAHPVPDAGTITDTGTLQRPIGAQQSSEPRGVH